MAETRPQTLDEFARISGVGAKKLENFGATFLEVIRGDAPDAQHPARRKLAGRETGTMYDRLVTVQAELARGEDGTHKPLSCSASLLAKIAELRPTRSDTLTKLLGERRAERFGDAFLRELHEN